MRVFLFLLLTLFAVLIIMDLPPVPQSENYHNFADKRVVLGIPNFGDVISSFSFLVVGVIGLLCLFRKSNENFSRLKRELPYVVFFGGLILISFGSAFYHLNPNNWRLLWDRMPMAICFMAFFSIVIGAIFNKKTANILLILLIILGIGSVIFWYLTELQGKGDLRVYIFIQFFPMAVIPLMVFLFPRRIINGKDIFIVLALYGIAKIFELLDEEIFYLTKMMSGHTLKHLVAASVSLWVLRIFRKNQYPLALIGHSQDVPEHF